MALWLLAVAASTASTDDGWSQRALLAADRLAVAAVDAEARTRPIDQLWWSGEGQQVLEMMDQRACIGSVVAGCVEGGPLPMRQAQAKKGLFQGRMRWDHSTTSWRIIAFEIVGADAVLWVWQAANSAKAAVPLVVPTPTAGSASPSPAPNRPWWLWSWVVAAFAFGAGRYLAQRRLRRQSSTWQQTAEALEEELEQERLRTAMTQGRHERSEEAWQARVTYLEGERRSADSRQVEALEDRLGRVVKQWTTMRQGWEREAQVSRRDAAQFLAPLQQLEGLFLQIERRMHAIGEMEFARLLQHRRQGLQGFTARWREHFDGVVTLNERSWERALADVEELLQARVDVSGTHDRDETSLPLRDFRQRLHVLRGGR